jgi:hypothetical protein
MAKSTNRRFQEVVQPTVFEEARDELFQQIVQCGVIGADPAHQVEWFGDTMAYVSDRYPELSATQLAELRTLGDRFVQPAKRAPETASSSASAA